MRPRYSVESTGAMKTILTALVIGAATEAALIAALAGGGFGPCGPTSSVSAFVFFIHAPGLWLITALHVPDPVGLWAVIGLYAGIWSGASLLILNRSRFLDSEPFRPGR